MMEGKKSTDSQSRRGRPMNVFFSFFLFLLLLLLLLPYYVAAQPSNGDGRFSNTNENFRPSMTVTIVVLAVACVVIAFFSFYIRRCSRDIHINGGGGGASLRLTRTRPAPVGLDASVIETFPTFLYSVVKGLKIGKGVLECAVCLNEFEDDETLRLLPKCDHVFHPECIDAWLSSHTTCPVCRAQLVPHHQSSSPQLVTPVSEESDIQPLNQQQQQQQSSSSSSSPAPEITQVSIHVVDDDDEPKPDVIATTTTTTTTVPIQNRPVRSKSMIKRIAGRFPRSHSTGHSVVQPTGGAAVDNYDRFTLKLPDDVRKQILNGKLSRTMSCVVTTGSVSSSGWRNDSIKRTSRRSSAGGGWSNHFGFGRNSMDRTTAAAAAAATKSGRWGFLRSASFLWRNNSSARLSKKGDGSTSKSDVVVLGTGGSQSPSSSTARRPPV